MFPCKGYVSNSPGGSEPAHLRFVWHVSLSFIQKDNSSLEHALVVIHLRSYYLKTCMLTALKWTSMYPLFHWSSVPTVPLVLCAHCSSVPTVPLVLCAHCSSGPLCPLFLWTSVPTVPTVGTFSTDFLCVKILALGRGVPSFFAMQMKNCRLNTGIKFLLKISRLRSSTVELCVWLLSRLVHHQLLHLSLCVYSI